MLASFLSEVRGDLTLRDVIRATVLAIIPVALVFVQPDIGTSIILASVLVALLVVAGTKARHLLVLAMVAVLAIFGAFQLHIIKDYQITRLTSFLDPAADPQRAGYNKQQAEIAIGAGGLLGKGYLQGSQTNLDYVPEQHTDFIFTVVGEELGFLRGAIPLLALFGLVLWRGLRTALLAKDPFGTFVCVGVLRHDRLPGLRERRHDDGHHADHRHPAAVHLVRRERVDRRLHRDRADPERPHAQIPVAPPCSGPPYCYPYGCRRPALDRRDTFVRGGSRAWLRRPRDQASSPPIPCVCAQTIGSGAPRAGHEGRREVFPCVVKRARPGGSFDRSDRPDLPVRAFRRPQRIPPSAPPSRRSFRVAPKGRNGS